MKKMISILCFISLIPISLFPQQSLVANTKYVNFEIDRIPVISGGYFLQNNLALEAGFGLTFNDEKNSNGLSIRLELDKYLGNDRLAPFCGGFTRFDINPNAMEDNSWKGSRLAIGGHWGLNYFILKNLSIAGTIGMELLLNSPKDKKSSTNVSTFTSGVKIRFFF